MRALSKWIVVKPLKSQGNEIFQTNVLSDGDAQIFQREIRQWNSMQAVTLGNEVRVECRLAPVSTF